jgi:hypothetical protein
VENRGQREADQRGCKGTAKNHDGGMNIEEHPQIAAHENERGEDNRPGQQA